MGKWVARGLACGGVIGSIAGGCGGKVTVKKGGSGGDSSTDVASSSVGTGGDSSTATSTATGMGGAATASSSTSAAGGAGGGECIDLAFNVTYDHDPTDVVIVVDNSASMSEEVAAVEQHLNAYLHVPLTMLDVDHRIIMLTQHGNSSLSVCIPPPLSNTTNCSGPPLTIPNQFYHYSLNVQSHDSWCRLLNGLYGNTPDQYNLAPGGWSQWLRPEALKAFIEISDDGSSCTAGNTTLNDGNNSAAGQGAALAFDSLLLAAAPALFGNSSDRRYSWYSIIGMAPKIAGTPEEPWLPPDAVTVSECTPGAVDPGTGYQWLSKGTEGLRFSQCSTASYGIYFAHVASDIERKTRDVCALPLPASPPPPDPPIDPLSLSLNVIHDNGVDQLTQIADPSQCAAGFFYIQADKAILCPETCTTVQGYPDPDMTFIAHCYF